MIEIDSSNVDRSAAKLQLARDRGALTVWLRWRQGHVPGISGVHVVDLTDLRPDVCESGHAMAKKLRCYLGLHRFVRRKSDDGQWYEECRDCGKFGEIPPPPPPFVGVGSGSV